MLCKWWQCGQPEGLAEDLAGHWALHSSATAHQVHLGTQVLLLGVAAICFAVAAAGVIHARRPLWRHNLRSDIATFGYVHLLS